jgi:LPXTG-site transpeptidase (sortase) family protein
MKRFLRAALSLLFAIGVSMALWPLGQMAYARWSQHTLDAAWRAAAQQSVAAAPARNNPGRTSQSGHSTGSSLRRTNASQKAVGRKLQSAAEWPPTRIVIPEIDLDAVVVQGWDEDALRRGPGHRPQSALPGQPGNCVIAAHRNVYGAWFMRLDALLPGSEIRLRTPHETFTYRVSLLYTAADNDPATLRAPTGPDASPRLTLITCTLPRSTSRVIVVAQLVQPETS